MNAQQRKALLVSVLGMSLLSSLIVADRVRSERYLDSLVDGGPSGMAAAGKLMNKEETAAFEARSRTFNAIWMARHERDVTQEILPYLQDPIANLRERAAQALARLEAPVAEAPLEELRQRTERGKAQAKGDFYKFGGAYPVVADIALSRVRSRKLRGEARVAAVAESVGLSWGEIIRLSQKVKEREHHIYEPRNAGQEIIEEMVSLLYVMGKKGENIRPLASRLALNPAQQVKLQAASLSLDEEINLMLDYLSGPVIGRAENYELAKKHFAGLGPRAAQLLAQRLADPSFSPKSPTMIFDAALAIHDPRFVPLLQRFEKDPNPRICHPASQVRARLEPDSRFPWYAPQMP